MAILSNPLIDSYLAQLEWVPVKSSNVARAGFLKDFGYLFVEFKSGMVYMYRGIGEDMWRGFLGAPSKGQWVYYVLRNKGRDDRYVYDQVR
jgi:hypothetical protein